MGISRKCLTDLKILVTIEIATRATRKGKPNAKPETSRHGLDPQGQLRTEGSTGVLHAISKISGLFAHFNHVQLHKGHELEFPQGFRDFPSLTNARPARIASSETVSDGFLNNLRFSVRPIPLQIRVERRLTIETS